MICVKQANDVKSKIALQPYNIHIRAVQNLEDARIGKDFVEDLQLPSPWLQRIDYPVLVARADLHQRHNSDIGSIVVVLKINGDFLRLLQLCQHFGECFGRFDELGCSGFEGCELFGLGVFIHG